MDNRYLGCSGGSLWGLLPKLATAVCSDSSVADLIGSRSRPNRDSTGPPAAVFAPLVVTREGRFSGCQRLGAGRVTTAIVSDINRTL